MLINVENEHSIAMYYSVFTVIDGEQTSSVLNGIEEMWIYRTKGPVMRKKIETHRKRIETHRNVPRNQSDGSTKFHLIFFFLQNPKSKLQHLNPDFPTES